MADYESDRLDALEAFKADGIAVILLVDVPGVADHAAGTVAEGSTISYPGYGIVKEYATRDVDGTTIQRGDQKLLVAFEDSTIEPTTEHNIQAPSTLYGIQNVSALAPGGVVIFYTLQVRR